jgi:DNA excision repair protein ERCC-2
VTEYAVSIRELAEFCYRRGDIDHRFAPSPTGVQGTEGHQRVFRRRPKTYQSEFPVEYQHRHEGLLLNVRGRADGYDAQAGLVEEIKTCRVNPQSIASSVVYVHLAQAKLYAALIAQQEQCEALEVKLTWLNIDSDEETSSSQTHSANELDDFLQSSLAYFSKWVAEICKQREERQQSLAALKFPHAGFRSGQRDIAELVYKCIDQSGQLLLEAPTGIGKTVAVLFPALKAVGAGKHDGLIYLTAKSVGRRAAEQAFVQFKEAGFNGPALSLTAKGKICLSPGKACHGDDCPYARGYYDKLPEARLAAIQSTSLDRVAIEALAVRYELCPYQLSLDLLPWVDLVIADLHYVYSLSATFNDLIDRPNFRWGLLVDEAHNLPSRARKMYSADLSKANLMKAKGGIDSIHSPMVAKHLQRINRAMLAMQKENWALQGFDSRYELPAKFADILAKFVAQVSEQMAANPVFLQQAPMLKDFFFDVLQFLRVADIWGNEFRFELDKGEGPQDLQLTLNCMDPSRLLLEKHKQLPAVVVFSATLSPISWTREVLGLAPEAVCRRLTSPFVAEQMPVSVASHIDTRYHQRTKSLPDLVYLLQKWILAEQGNCIVYFPSYRYLEDCMAALQACDLTLWERTIWRQSAQQTETERNGLLALLKERRDVLAFCILGGVFGEGIDLPGDQLAAVVVIGVGLPQLSRDNEQLRKYFDERYGQGFRYAYVYPGMQKVDQALGRVIRRSSDRGRALLVDARYQEAEYTGLLPPWWQYTAMNV